MARFPFYGTLNPDFPFNRNAVEDTRTTNQDEPMARETKLTLQRSKGRAANALSLLELLRS